MSILALPMLAVSPNLCCDYSLTEPKAFIYILTFIACVIQHNECININTCNIMCVVSTCHLPDAWKLAISDKKVHKAKVKVTGK